MYQRTFYRSCPYGGQLVVQIIVLLGDYEGGRMMIGTIKISACHLILMRTFVIIWYRYSKCPLVFGVSTGDGDSTEH